MFDGKYGKVTLEKKPDVPDDEPCFVLRGQDVLASDVVRIYAQVYVSATHDEEGYRAIMNQVINMENWPTRKLPD